MGGLGEFALVLSPFGPILLRGFCDIELGNLCLADGLVGYESVLWAVVGRTRPPSSSPGRPNRNQSNRCGAPLCLVQRPRATPPIGMLTWLKFPAIVKVLALVEQNLCGIPEVGVAAVARQHDTQLHLAGAYVAKHQSCKKPKRHPIAASEGSQYVPPPPALIYVLCHRLGSGSRQWSIGSLTLTNQLSRFCLPGRKDMCANRVRKQVVAIVTHQPPTWRDPSGKISPGRCVINVIFLLSYLANFVNAQSWNPCAVCRS